MKLTSVFEKNVNAYLSGRRVIAHKGSSRSSKTWSILQTLFMIALKSEKPRLISVVSESMPHLKRGCIRDFRNILEADSLFNENDWNATDKLYKIGKCTIEFFSADQASKVLGSARDILYINECINVPYSVYRHLAVRTTETIFLDYNPEYEFWVDEKLAPESSTQIIHSTYKDNDFLSPEQVADIEAQKLIDPDWFKVYGEGLTGSAQGLILKNWDIVKSMPNEFAREWVGIDFGYAAPSAIAHMRRVGNEIYIRQIMYAREQSNQALGRAMEEAGLRHVQIVADCAEPKSIAELRSLGFDVLPSKKGRDSIESGLRTMNRYKKHYTQDSVDFIKENRLYKYRQSATGNYDLLPVKDKNDHSIDAQRYVFTMYLSDISGGFDYRVG